MGRSRKTIGIIHTVILGLVALMYLSGLLGQLLVNYSAWLESGEISLDDTMPLSNGP